MNRSLVCSIGEHRSCDGFSPNASDTPCDCACQHEARLTPIERERERRRAQQRARLASWDEDVAAEYARLTTAALTPPDERLAAEDVIEVREP